VYGDLWDRDDCEQLGLEIALIADESAIAAGAQNGATENDLLACPSHFTTIDEPLDLFQGLSDTGLGPKSAQLTSPIERCSNLPAIQLAPNVSSHPGREPLASKAFFDEHVRDVLPVSRPGLGGYLHRFTGADELGWYVWD